MLGWLLLATALSTPALSVAAANERPPSLRAACGSASDLSARPLWLTTADGVRLYAIEAGHGATAVVLAHQGGEDLCGELPFARTLVNSGLRVLAFDFRGWGRSDNPRRDRLALRRDLASAVARLHREGAKHVFLIGASMGGAAVVQNSGGVRVTGLVSLSGTRLWPGYGINKPGPRSLRAPFLYVGSKNDSRAPLPEAREIFRRVGSRDKQSVFFAGGWHGWTLVQDAPFASRTRALILAWIRARS
jgi:pimeloyl-ACP methyl ester carboxylesterase